MVQGLPLEGQGHPLVDLELLLLRGEVVPGLEHELRAEQPHAVQTVLPCPEHVGLAAHVGLQLQGDAVGGAGGPAHKLPQGVPQPHELFPVALPAHQLVGREPQVHLPFAAIHHGHLPAGEGVEDVGGAHHCGDLQRPGQNGAVGGLSAMGEDDSHHVLRVQAGHRRQGQVVGDEHGAGGQVRQVGLRQAQQNAEQPIPQVPHVRGPQPQHLLGGGGEAVDEPLALIRQGGLGGLAQNDLPLDALSQYRVQGHGRLAAEDVRPHPLLEALGALLSLGGELPHRGPVALQLPLRVLDGLAPPLQLRLPVDQHPADADAWGGPYPAKDTLHGSRSFPFSRPAAPGVRRGLRTWSCNSHRSPSPGLAPWGLLTLRTWV